MTEQKSFMQKAWSALGSMRLFFFLSVLIAFWCVVLLAMYPRYIVAVYSLNDYVVLDWLLSGQNPDAAPLRGWLVALGAMMALLSVNLIVCVIEDMRILFRLIGRKAAAGTVLGRTGILLMHLAYVTVISGHFLTACTGYKISFVPEQQKSYSFEQTDLKVRVHKMKTGPDQKKPGAQVVKMVRLTIEDQAGSEMLPLKNRQTIQHKGRLLTLNMAREGIEGCPDPEKGLLVCNPPEIKIAKNPGLPVTILGALIFFPGIVLRMIFRSRPN